MTNLVIAEHDGASIKAATLNTIAAAQKIGGDVHVLVAGHDAQAAAEAAAKIAGVSKVLLADAPQLAAGLAENVEATVLTLLQNPAKGYPPRGGRPVVCSGVQACQCIHDNFLIVPHRLNKMPHRNPAPCKETTSCTSPFSPLRASTNSIHSLR